MLIEELHRNQVDGKETDLILLDFSKAFDKVNHEKLIHKLHGYGARVKTLSRIKTFLNRRTQAVVLESGISLRKCQLHQVSLNDLSSGQSLLPSLYVTSLKRYSRK